LHPPPAGTARAPDMVYRDHSDGKSAWAAPHRDRGHKGYSDRRVFAVLTSL
jgi:hypothetical protein